MAGTIFVLNGSNLNLLGEREPSVYGHDTLADVEALCRRRGEALGFAIDFRQTNYEGALVESIHEARKAARGVVINPAGFSFSSVPVYDALKTFEGPIVEVHISNIHKREPIYHDSLVSKVATGVIAGLGIQGYELALDALGRTLR